MNYCEVMASNPLERPHAMKVLITLSKGGKTFSELLLDSRITPTTLTRRLKEFQSAGLVGRAEKSDSKRGEVIYSLSKKGEKLIPHLLELLKELSID